MKIKRVLVHGFKSFADKTEVEFGEGLTAIVGPNGSGKSNIADAVKWVLGEQSARALRGSRMEDVIFGGTAKRKSIGFAEVTIIFDNESLRLPTPFTEVAITRRVYRNLESEYFINKRPCRLKDITELFLDTGIGRDSYSFVGQGRIEEMLSADPRNRRVIFEEAAGISRYKLRKRETETRLAETAANLLRIKDVTAELEAQLGPLAAESERAKSYQGLAVRRRSLEQSLLDYELTLNERQTQSLGQQAERLRDDLLRGELARSSLLAQQAAQSLLDSEIQARLQDGERSLYEKRLVLRQKDERRSEAATQLEKLGAQRNLLQERLQDSRVEQQKIALRLAHMREDEAAATSRQKEARSEIAELDSAEDAPTLGREALLKEAMESLSSTLFQHERELTAQTKQVVLLEERLSAHCVTQQALKTQGELELKRHQEQEAAVSAEKIRLAELVLEEQAVKSHLADLRQKQKQLETALSAKQSELFRAENRLRAQKASEEQMEGLSRGVKFILKARLPGVLGVVGDLISTSPKLETAIEVALGGAVADIVTATEGQAKEAIKRLKDSNQGRATFYPIDSLRPRSAREVPTGLRNHEAFMGRAVDLVSSTQELRPLVEQLLGNVLVVANLDTASFVAKETGHIWRIVTLEGDIRLPSGSLTGGSRPERQAWLLARKRESEDSAKDALRLRQELQLLEGEQASWQATMALALARVENLRATIDGAKRTLLGYELSQAKTAALIEQYTRESEGAHKAEQANVYEQAECRRQIAYLEQAIAAARAEQATLATEAEELARVNAELGHKRVIREQRRMELRLDLARTEAQVAGLAARLTEHEGLLADALKRTTELALECATLESEGIRLENLLAELRVEMGNFAAEVELLSELVLQLQQERLAMQARHQEIVAALENNTQESNALRLKLHNMELRLERLKVEAEHLLAKRAEYGPAGETEGVNISSRAEAESAIEVLDQEILALGPVRLSSIEEFTRLSERVAFLSQEEEDLTRSSERLKEVIASLDSVMGERFLTGFQEVKSAFQDMVNRLFGGASSRLSLTDKDKPLESGIEIDVQPVGKRLQNISLLSGGERTLVAIALICAVLKVKPTPFCVLDETDAALDDANVGRLIGVLRELSLSTQFLLITHTKGTMLAADMLYGVTMPEQGVSKVLTVRVSELASS